MKKNYFMARERARDRRKQLWLQHNNSHHTPLSSSQYLLTTSLPSPPSPSSSSASAAKNRHSQTSHLLCNLSNLSFTSSGSTTSAPSTLSSSFSCFSFVPFVSWSTFSGDANGVGETSQVKGRSGTELNRPAGKLLFLSATSPLKCTNFSLWRACSSWTVTGWASLFSSPSPLALCSSLLFVREVLLAGEKVEGGARTFLEEDGPWSKAVLPRGSPPGCSG
ncbi:hypothetical protein QOT17_017429 [Balamuthia mandrillaris]